MIVRAATMVAVTRRLSPQLALAFALTPIAVAGCGDDPPTSAEQAPTAPATTGAPSTSLSMADTTGVPEVTMPPTKPPTMPPIRPPDVPDPAGGSTPDPALGDREYAIADLRARLGNAAEIEFVSQEEVTWRDGSLGCPQPGWSYTQALVNGTRIVLRHDGILYEYHSGGQRRPFYCAPQFVEPPSESTTDPGPGGA
jgi:hypothetical protein